MLYNIQEDAQARLGRTVVLYDSKPYLVDQVSKLQDSKTFCLRLLELPNYRNHLDVMLDDPKLNYTNYQIGYANVFAGGRLHSFYLSRMPCRNPYKQGLCANNISITCLDPRDRDMVNWDILCQNGSINEMFTQSYPTLEKAVQELEKAFKKNSQQSHTIAFHRQLALMREPLGFYKLLYRGEDVAWGDPDALQLPSQYMYLSELLTELGVKIR